MGDLEEYAESDEKLISEKMNWERVYAEHYEKGYVWVTNGGNEQGGSAELYEMMLRKREVDFIVEKRAFTMSGKEDDNMVAFLVKKEQREMAREALEDALRGVQKICIQIIGEKKEESREECDENRDDGPGSWARAHYRNFADYISSSRRHNRIIIG